MKLSNKRYSPVFPNNEASSFINIQKDNGLFVTREEALIQRTNSGEKPVGLLILQIVPLEDSNAKDE